MSTQLSENELEKVIGGAEVVQQTLDKTKKQEFEAAWDALKMEQKGYTGNMRAELFEDWEMADFKPDAVSFLSKIK